MNRLDTCQGLVGPSACSAEMPYTDIASSILVKAVSDWRRYKCEIALPRDASYRFWLDREGFYTARQELKKFFLSEWCEFLVGAVIDIPYRDFLKAIGASSE